MTKTGDQINDEISGFYVSFKVKSQMIK